MPGMPVSRATFAGSTADDQIVRLDAGQHRQRELRTDAADADQPLEHLQLEQRRESVQHQRIFAHVRVNAQRDLRAGLGQIVERRERHLRVVAHTLTSTMTRFGCFSSSRPRRCAIMQLTREAEGAPARDAA